MIFTAAGCSAPEADDPPIQQAKQALADGDGLGAELILRDLLASGAPRPEVAAYLGEAELQQGELAEARKWLEPGDFTDESVGHGFHMLAKLEMAAGNLPAAGQAFDKALAVKRENPELWVDIGRLRYRGGEQAEAVEASIYAVEIDPANPAALRFRAQLLRDAEGLAAAGPWFERALERNPDDVGLLYDYAATLGELGLASEMLSVVRKIAKIDPAYRKIYYLQAVLAARAGKFELAQSMLLRSSREDRDTPAGQLLAGIIDLENGNFASAAQTLERLSAAQPDNRRVSSLFARALAMGGNDKELVYRFENVAALPSASPYLTTLVGRSLEVLDRRDDAARYLDKAARPRSGNLVAVSSATPLGVAEARGPASGMDALALVRARITAGNGRGAVAAADDFLNRFPGSSDAITMAADASLVAHDYPKAIERYERAARIRGPWTATRKHIKALEAAGQTQDSARVLTDYLRGDPSNLEAAVLLSMHAGGEGRWDAAAALADHAIRNGGHRDPSLLALRAEIALRRNEDIALALEYAEIAYALQPMSADTTRTLALVYRKAEGFDDLAGVLEAKLKAIPR
ncbi:tetratricopeptide repeat protein [Pontixanthobacter luteolus]|uniref:tetratricopeptide repeat protein n=1 Tax=Pontixanthobacter luteolus TaxID=295089 RepID=UPI00230262B2|nr:tetratricopeptide repeat protein [Pontixanthobacter luteolus]